MHTIELQFNGRRVRPGRIFCIGRNYAAHARELDNPVPEEPVIFMKPPSSLVADGGAVGFPSHGEDLQFEAEVVYLLGSDRRIAGVSLGIDLTLRDIQQRLKSKGLPWERAKAFEGSAMVGRFVDRADCEPLEDLRFECCINGQIRQRGHCADMLFAADRIVAELASVWTLAEGDLVFSGTPEGVGSLQRGDLIEVSSTSIGRFSWRIL